jgi:hypothetical protein
VIEAGVHVVEYCFEELGSVEGLDGFEYLFAADDVGEGDE